MSHRAATSSQQVLRTSECIVFSLYFLSLSLKLQCPRIIRLTKRWDLLLYSKSTKVIPKKENSAQTQCHRLPSRFVSAACLPSVGSALPIVRSTGWLWRQVSVIVFRTKQGPLSESQNLRLPGLSRVRRLLTFP